MKVKIRPHTVSNHRLIENVLTGYGSHLKLSINLKVDIPLSQNFVSLCNIY